MGDLAGEYEGVVYRDHFEFNLLDIYDVLIAWRHNVYNDPPKRTEDYLDATMFQIQYVPRRIN